MSRWRRVIEKELQPDTWALHLECGHEAFRSAYYNPTELPDRVLCHACESLIGSTVKTLVGKVGTVASYKDGRFEVTWHKDGVTRSTLDELREEMEII